ncbi:MAG: Calx-beta domain-containing protein [Planctomycetaceae bacterium]
MKSRSRRRRGNARIERLEERALLAAQVITATPTSQNIVPGEDVSIDVAYSTLDDTGNVPADPGLQTTTLGLRLHYDSSVLTFNDPLNNVFTTNLTQQADQEDTSDFDNDATTDRFINVAWTDIGAMWPGTSNTQPVALFTANFTTAAEFTGTTTVRFSRSANPVGFDDFEAEPVTVSEFVIPEISIADAVAVDEGANAEFVVTLDRVPTGEVTVQYNTATGSAGTGDFTAQTAQTLTFAAGTTTLTQTISVATLTDGLVEPAEDFTVILSSPTNGTIAAGADTGTGTINSLDVPQFSVDNPTAVAEGSDVVFTVSIDQLPLADITVAVATGDGSATEPGDYTAVPLTTLTFTPTGPLTQTVTVNTHDDDEVEGEETFTLDLSSPVGGTIQTGQGTATITSEDVPTVSISGSPTVAEGAAAAFTLTVSEAPIAGQDLTVTVTTASGTATDGTDYPAFSQEFTFTSTGATSQDVIIPTTDDSLVEMDEDFTVNLGSVQNGTILTGAATGIITSEDVPAFSIDSPAAVAEGTDVVFTVSIDQLPLSDISVDVVLADGTAVSPDDYTTQALMTLTFTPTGETTQTVTVTTIDDDDLEADETFTADLSNAVGATIAVNQGTATLTSDDVPAVSITGSPSVAEGSDASFVVSVSEAPLAGQDLMVTVTSASGTATDGTDYPAFSQTLTFTSTGSTSQTVTVPTTDDSLVESDETFTLTLSDVQNGTIDVAAATSTGTITSADVPAFSVDSPASVTEGTDIVFTVSIDQAPLTDVSIDVVTADDSAVAPGDYTALTTQTLTFTPTGALTQTVTVTTIDDADIEGIETFFLNLSNEIGATIAGAQGTGTMISNDGPSVSISDAADTAEGGTAVFTVTLSQLPAVGADITVQVDAVSGTATAGTDFTVPAVTTLTFTSTGTLTQTISVVTTDDSAVEGSESFTVQLSNIQNGTLAAASGSATILDNDVPAVSVDSVTVTEGQNAVFSVSLDQAPAAGQTVIVTLSTANGSAVAPDDYTAIVDRVLTFTSTGELTQTVIVPTINDTLNEQTESFVLNVTGATGATFESAQGTATLLSDDGPEISISSSASVTEGADAVFTITLSALPAAGEDVTVDVITVDDTAEAGSDYTAFTQTLTFTSTGELSQDVTITTIDDSDVEGEQQFIVRLVNAGNGTITDSDGVVTVQDNDQPTVSIADISVTEGEDAVFTITLDIAPLVAVTFDIVTADGSATAGSDYTALASQTITFSPGGELTQTVTVSTTDDTDLEDVETFVLNLTNAANVTVGNASATASIISNDGPSISISADSTSVAEGAAVTLTVTLSEAPTAGNDVTVVLSTVDGTAVAGTDYVGLTQTLTFTSTGALTQQVIVQTTDDATVEPTKTFDVQLSSPSNGGITTGSVTVSVTSSDVPKISVAKANPVQEGGVATFVVSLDQAPLSTVSVTVATSDGLATAGSDYTAVPATVLTFEPGGALTQEVEVTTLTDAVSEANERLFLDLTSPVGATIETAQNFANIIGDRPTLAAVPRYPTDLSPTITWGAIDGATSYEVWVERRFPANARILTAESIVTTNSFTPAADLSSGAYQVWVRSLNANGDPGPWSQSERFEVRPTLISPLAPTFVKRPTFQWEAIPNAPGYTLFLQTTAGTMVLTDLTATTYTPAADLPSGPINWWVRSSDAVFNLGWSEVGQTGNRTHVLSPTGSLDVARPTFTWQAVLGATRYDLYVLNHASGEVVLRQPDLTGAAFTPTADMPDGNYRVWVKAIETDFASGEWSAPVDFTVNVGGNTQPLGSLNVTLSAPSGTVATATPTYTWSAVAAASRYELFVMDLSTNTRVVTETDLTGTSFTPTTPLTENNYRVWVRAIDDSTNRVGSWSSPLEFTVEVASVEDADQDSLIALSSLNTEVTTVSTVATSESTVSDNATTTATRNAVDAGPATTQDDQSDVEDVAALDAWMADPAQVAVLVESESQRR